MVALGVGLKVEIKESYVHLDDVGDVRVPEGWDGS